MKNNNVKVLQPLRFVDAHFNLTPTQHDFIMLVQKMTNKQPIIKTDFKIDLRPYFEDKGIQLKNVRSNHYDTICKDLLSASVRFQYFKGNTLFNYYSLFKKCSVDNDFFLTISIIEDVLPLFYINKLNEGHFKENKLVKDLFQKSFPEIDKYISYLPKTYVDFEESSTKRLFQKLLQYRMLGKYTYEFSKDELYLLLGCGEYVEKKEGKGQQNIFDIKEYEFIQTKYKDVYGWKNLYKQLNTWLKIISEHKDSELSIVKNGKSYFKTVGRPIRSIKINVVFDDLKGSLSDEQEETYIFLEKFGLSDKQRYSISKNFDLKTVKEILHQNIIAKKDHNGNRVYGEYKRADYRIIKNLPGFIYTVFFKKT